MEYRHLGKDRLKVSAIGYGCPPFQGKLSEADEKQAIAVLHRAIDIGINFIDTADHNNGNNEEILAKALKGKRGAVVLTTKFGNLRGQPWAEGREVEGKPEYVSWACENSLRRLESDYIDLYYLHRVDPEVAIEDTVGAMARLVEQGKVRHIGLSEAGAQTLRRANAVHPVTAVQSEYSLWWRKPEAELLPTLEELGIGLVPYSPLGKGFLTGRIDQHTTFDQNDFRNTVPRFAPENRQANRAMVELLTRVAGNKGATPAQIALAWLLAQKPWIVPIPGTTKIHRLEENLGAANVELTREDLREIADAAAEIPLQGARYSESSERMVDR